MPVIPDDAGTKPSTPTVATGCKAKHTGAPPLEPSMLQQSQPSSSSGVPPGVTGLAPHSSKAVSGSSHRERFHHHAVPGPVAPPKASTTGRLVCSPYEMKNFLYGTQQKISASSSGSTSAEPVLRMHYFGLTYFNSLYVYFRCKLFQWVY